jgi:hypothetical protein
MEISGFITGRGCHGHSISRRTRRQWSSSGWGGTPPEVLERVNVTLNDVRIPTDQLEKLPVTLHQVLKDAFNVEMKWDKLKVLRPNLWLNDEVSCPVFVVNVHIFLILHMTT